MINFRYHVVSLTAVFLALAIGLVLGTAALNGPLSDSLYEEVQSLRKQNGTLRDQVDHMGEEAARREQFVRDIAPQVLAGKLASKRVLVVSDSDGDKDVQPAVEMLELAGAKVTGRIRIDARFTDPEQGDALLDVAEKEAPFGVTLPSNQDGVESSAALLAAVLLDRSSPLSSQTQTKILALYRGLRMISDTGKVTGTAEAVVFVTGTPATDQEGAKRNANMVTIVRQFAKLAPTVVASRTIAGDGNTVAEVRGDSELQKSVSTVDNVGTPQGQLTAALALAELITQRKGSHYGVGNGANALVPKAIS